MSPMRAVAASVRRHPVLCFFVVFAIFPWVATVVGFYGASELVGMNDFPNVQRALAAFTARPAVARGMAIPKRG